MSIPLLLRAEVKGHEHRTPLTPANAKKLLDSGRFTITVEKSDGSSSARCYSDSEYEAAGCKIIAADSWPTVEKGTTILGLKELPEATTPHSNDHIFFAHAFKGQDGWSDVLKRFVEGGSTLYDLEYLENEDGRRIAAFGPWAGFSGCAFGILAYCHQVLNDNALLPPVSTFASKEAMTAAVTAQVNLVKEKTGALPTVMVMGALGRCGKAATECAELAGLTVTKWDMAETKAGGPFGEIIKHEIFVNCILLSSKIPPFIDGTLVADAGRKLQVIADVSCDPTSPFNPIPLYGSITEWEKPTTRVIEPSAGLVLDVLAIDNLPSLLPAESSTDFSDALQPYLLDLPSGPVWQRAKKVFEEKSAPLR